MSLSFCFHRICQNRWEIIDQAKVCCKIRFTADVYVAIVYDSVKKKKKKSAINKSGPG